MCQCLPTKSIIINFFVTLTPPNYCKCKLIEKRVNPFASTFLSFDSSLEARITRHAKASVGWEKIFEFIFLFDIVRVSRGLAGEEKKKASHREELMCILSRVIYYETSTQFTIKAKKNSRRGWCSVIKRSIFMCPLWMFWKIKLIGILSFPILTANFTAVCCDSITESAN